MSQPGPRILKNSAHNWHGSAPPGGLTQAAEPAARTAAQTMVEQLCALGLDTFFGVPGGPIIPIFDAILTHPTARLIEPRHETYGAFAAMGFHRASGKVPVVVVTAGPGATNVITGVAAAHLERVPMLLLCGDVPWAGSGRKMFQDSGDGGVGIERMLRGVTRAVVRVAHQDSAGAQMRAALQAAADPRCPGPAAVIIAIDRSGAHAAAPAIHAPPPGVAMRPVPPDAGLLHRVGGLLHTARRPLIVVGAGCLRDADRVRRLIDRTGIPFMTTPQAKGLVPEDHPLSLRTGGAGSSVWAQRYCEAGPDVALALGTDLDDMSMAGTPPIGPGGALIHVDTDASVFARNLPTAVGAAYDVGAFAAALLSVVALWDGPRDGEALLAEARAVAPYSVPAFAEDDATPPAPHRILADLMRAAGPRSTFVADIGEHTLFALHYVTATEDRRFVVHQGLGSMGSGIGSAAGLALGDPTRRVVCLCGDGGMSMAGMEVLVARKLGLPVVYAVFNDARYNMVYHGYRMLYGREAPWDTPQVDFAAWAEALGVRGRRIDRPGQITAELLDELTRGGQPAVLDIRHDPSLRISNNGRVESLRKMMEA